MRTFKSCFGGGCCGDASDSQLGTDSNSDAWVGKASQPVDVQRTLQKASDVAHLSSSMRAPPTASGGTATTAAPLMQHVSPDGIGALRPSDSSSSSCHMIVQRPRPKCHDADASAGRPTVTGQLLAQNIASESPPAPSDQLPYPTQPKRQKSLEAPVKSFEFVRPPAGLYDLPSDVLYAEAGDAPVSRSEHMGDVNAVQRKGAPILADDQQRIDAMCSMGISADQELRFDDITRLVSTIFGAPIALVSLVEQERQWFKSVVGLQVTETPRSTSFCAWTLLPVNPEVLVVENALEDPRFRDNSLVTGPPYIRFYAGSPLVTAEGHRLGSLCVIDPKPRKFDAESCNLLCNFAEMVVREIEKDKLRVTESIKLQNQTSSLMRAIDTFNEAIMLVDMAEGHWTLMFVNDAWLRLMDMSREEATGSDLWTVYDQPHHRQEANMATAQRMVAARQEFTLEVHLRRGPSSGTASPPHLLLDFRPAASETFGHAPQIGIPGFVPWKNQLPSYFFATVQRPASAAHHDPPSLSSQPSISSTGSASRWRPQPVMGREEPFDDVKLGPLLGKGSFGRVFRGIWNGVPVAVKVVESPLSASASQQQVMFEADRGVALRHPHVVQTFKTHTTICKAEGRGYQETWLLLELCDKGSLRDAMDRGAFRPVRLGEATTWVDVAAIMATAKEVAAGMAYLHSDDILHGDLTAGNILLTSATKDERQFVTKIADFGLSRELTDTSISTGTYGTVTHMPPELLSSGRLSKSADTYAFGVLLWEMFTGQRPWGGMLQMQIIFNITVQKKKLDFPPDTPKPFLDLGRRCMAVDPHMRPSFLQILSELQAIEDAC